MPRAPSHPTATPTATAIPTCRKSSVTRSAIGSCSSATIAASTNTTNTGSAIPSFRPLSTLSAWRMRRGTRGFDTTALPSAASVGASIAARIAASHTSRSPRITEAPTQPSPIINGRPIPSRRAGMTSSLHVAELIALASVKSTTTRVATSTSEMSSTSPARPLRSTRPRTSGPINRPSVVNTMVPVTADRSSRSDTSANATKANATIAAVYSMLVARGFAEWGHPARWVRPAAWPWRRRTRRRRARRPP